MAQYTLTATGVITLGVASYDRPAEWVIHVSGTHVGSTVTQGFMAGSTLTVSDAQQLAYKPADTQTWTDPGGTAITANGIYVVTAPAGVNVSLSWTRSSGSIVVDATPQVL